MIFVDQIYRKHRTYPEKGYTIYWYINDKDPGITMWSGKESMFFACTSTEWGLIDLSGTKSWRWFLPVNDGIINMSTWNRLIRDIFHNTELPHYKFIKLLSNHFTWEADPKFEDIEC